MVWGIKKSFLDYVGHLDDKAEELAEGSGVTSHGEYFFTYQEPPDTPSGGQYHFLGGIRIRAHFGMLDVFISQPHIELDGDTGSMSVETSDGQEWIRISLVQLTVQHRSTNKGYATLVASARLTEEGSRVFGGVYPSNEEFDPVLIRIPERKI